MWNISNSIRGKSKVSTRAAFYDDQFSSWLSARVYISKQYILFCLLLHCISMEPP